MMLVRFTQRPHNVISLAHKEALGFGHTHLGTAHLLLGLSGESASVAAGVLRRLGVELGEARAGRERRGLRFGERGR